MPDRLLSENAVVEAIEARLSAATPGPWERGNRYAIAGVLPKMFGEGRCSVCQFEDEPIWRGKRDINGTVMEAHVHVRSEPWMQGVVHYDGNGEVWHIVIETDEYGLMTDGDAEFIAHAREDIETLLAVIRALPSALSPPEGP